MKNSTLKAKEIGGGRNGSKQVPPVICAWCGNDFERYAGMYPPDAPNSPLCREHRERHVRPFRHWLKTFMKRYRQAEHDSEQPAANQEHVQTVL